MLILAAAVAARSYAIRGAHVVLRENVRASWAEVGSLLAERHRELPELIAMCRPHLADADEIFDKMARARDAIAAAAAAGDVAAVGAGEERLRTALRRLLGLAGKHPRLSANASFWRLRADIARLDKAIAERGEVYNGHANLLNIRIQSFPDALVAGRFGFRPVELLEFTPDLDTSSV